ncbi:MAG: phosphoketolase family protein [Candidatus Dojkabacteria bacterium]
MDDIERTLDAYKKHHRLTNYLSASMLYLKDNFLLEEELKPEHFKTRVLGHWGTVPGLNFIYGGLNYIIKKRQQELLFIAGPGHGAPAVLSNVFLEGTLGEFYPDYQINKEGFGNLIHDFSWPGKFPSHTSPMVPGAIGEGGELGYSLAIASGAVMDSPDLTAVCVIGDGEAETATLATSWHSPKFLNPIKDGTVLPILHLNGYKISGPTIFSSMSDEEITSYFNGLGYMPIIVNQYTSEDIYIDFLEALITAFNDIDEIKAGWAEYEFTKAVWPMIVLKTKKGWTGIKTFKGKDIEDNNLSHGIPLKNPSKDVDEFEAVKEWLESYNVKDLVDDDYSLVDEISNFIPKDNLRMGVNKYAYGSELIKELKLPPLEDHELKNFARDSRPDSRLEELSEYLRDVFRLNGDNTNFRIFSPDESESNLIEALFQATDRVYEWPIRAHDLHIAKDGKILEVLSENLLFAWMQGYTVSGGHGLLISYEAFLNIVSSQLDQYIKYIKQWNAVSFRKPLPAFNLLSTSTLWRQEHNGFTHQNPTLINSLLVKQTKDVAVYFPADVNTLLVTTEKVMLEMNKVNLITACKRDLPQWFKLDEARELVRKGYMEVEWAGTGGSDVTLVSAGDYQTNETIEAAKLLKKIVPELGFKYINVNQLNPYGIGSENNLINSKDKFNEIFGRKNGVIFNFHGYPEAIKQLTWDLNVSERLKILGYIEEGTTTTPFDMEVKNKASRYHVCIEAIKMASHINKAIYDKQGELIKYFEDLLDKHRKYIIENSEDMPEVR